MLVGVLVLVVISIAFFLRTYQVGISPSGILIDEASFGYNAYSILLTGKDEHKVLLPLVFKAFGDQKLPFYTYALLPFIKVWGLTNLAVRLPSVIAGSLLSGVMLLLLLAMGFSMPLSFLGGLVIATSPWSLILSRFGFESNVGVFFFMMGILFAYGGYKKNSVILHLAAGISFALTLYCYVSFKLITPLFLVGLFAIQYKLFPPKKSLFQFLALSFLICIMPIIMTLFSSQTTARFTQVGLTYSKGLTMEINEDRAFCGTKLPAYLCYAFSNKPLFYARTYINRLVTSLSPPYLFLEGDTEYTYLNVDHFGSFYVWLIPFYCIGLALLWKKISTRSLTLETAVLLLGLMLSPLPTILVSGPQKVRISALFPFIALTSMFGMMRIESLINKKWLRYSFYMTMALLSFVSAIYFMVHFLTIHIHKYETSYGTYIPKLMSYLGSQNQNTQIYIHSIPEGIMYYAYVNKVDPRFYQNNVVFKEPDAIGFAHAKDLGNIHITEQGVEAVACSAAKKSEHALFVSNENLGDVPEIAKKIIYSENGVDTLAIIYDLSFLKTDPKTCR